jgi:flagellar basal-body rod protein FlgF
MSDGIYSATSGAISQQRSLEVVANNLANATATGFRGDRVAFREALAGANGQNAPATNLRFVAVSRVKTDDSQGGLKQTANPLDVALEGEGYFAVSTPRGERYTRAGAFVMDADGVIRTRDGYAVVGDSGPNGISIPSGTASVEISPDGTVSADGSPLDRFKIVAFTDPNSLIKEGDLLFQAPPGLASNTPVNTEVAQGFIETANVNAVSGLNELITANRSFEAFQRVIRTYGQIDERTAKELGSES